MGERWHNAAKGALTVATLIAASGFLYAAYRIGGSQEAYHLEAQNYAEAAARNAGPRIQRECASMRGAAFAKCADEIIDATHEAQRSEYYLEATRKAANGTVWLVIAGAVELALTFWGILLIRGQLRSTRAAVTAAQATTNAYIAIERPRLLPSAFEAVPLLDASGIQIKLGAENIGKTTAAVHTIEHGVSDVPKWPRELSQETLPQPIIVDPRGVPQFVHEFNAKLVGDQKYVMGRVIYRSAFFDAHISYFGFVIKTVGTEKTISGWTADSFHKDQDWPKDT